MKGHKLSLLSSIFHSHLHTEPFLLEKGSLLFLFVLSMAAKRLSSLARLFPQSTQAHRGSQYLRAAKHSQYSLRHFDFLQWQPIAVDFFGGLGLGLSASGGGLILSVSDELSAILDSMSGMSNERSGAKKV